MFKTIIFVDYENIKYISKEKVDSNTKIVLFVGKGLQDKALEFVKTHINNVYSIEIINITVQGSNVLDFFLVFYLGKYIEEIKNSNIIICSEDKDYDPVINHLIANGLSLEKITVKKEGQEEHISQTLQEKYDKTVNHFKAMTKAIPRKLPTLTKFVKTNIKDIQTSKQEAKQIVDLMLENNIIEVINTETGTIKFKQQANFLSMIRARLAIFF
jgi:hypothetical protein